MLISYFYLRIHIIYLGDLHHLKLCRGTLFLTTLRLLIISFTRTYHMIYMPI